MKSFTAVIVFLAAMATAAPASIVQRDDGDGLSCELSAMTTLATCVLGCAADTMCDLNCALNGATDMTTCASGGAGSDDGGNSKVKVRATEQIQARDLVSCELAAASALVTCIAKCASDGLCVAACSTTAAAAVAACTSTSS